MALLVRMKLSIQKNKKAIYSFQKELITSRSAILNGKNYRSVSASKLFAIYFLMELQLVEMN